MVTLRRMTVAAIWLVAAVLAWGLHLVVPGQYYYTGVSLAFGFTIMLTFILQLALASKDGLVTRIMLSALGSAIILLLATAVVAIIDMFSG